MQAEALQIKARCGEMVEKIKTLYGMDLSQVRISFDMRGRAAGKAGGKGYSMSGSSYYVKFNRDMLTREAFEHIIQDTVPHEYAHVVCYMDPTKGKNHDYGWTRVCRALGGTGARTHSEDVVFGKGITYEYTTDRGHKVRLNERRHQTVQRGIPLTYNKGKGTVRMGCTYSIVGHAGRTLAAPIVKQVAEEAGRPQRITVVPATKEVPVEAFTMLVPPLTVPVVARPAAGESKAAVSRRIMLSGTTAGHSYEQIIDAMMFANGYDRQLARATYKANAPKLGIPVQ